MRIRIWAMVAAFVILGAVSTQAATPKSPPPNKLLDGTYAGSGTVLEWFTPNGGTALKLDAAFVAVTNFDGNGHFSGSFTSTIAPTNFAASPTICVYSQNGTYNVNPDGTGTASALQTTSSPGCDTTNQPATFNLAVSSGGDTVCLVGVGAGASVTYSNGDEANSIVSAICSTRQ